MKIAEPHQGIFNKIFADSIAARVIKVDGASPGCMVLFSEIRTELVEYISLRSEVVVHHIQYHGQTVVVASIHQFLQAFSAAVRLLHCVRKHTVITPVSLTGKGRHRHDFYGCNTQLFYM